MVGADGSCPPPSSRSVVALLRRLWVGRGVEGWVDDARREVPAVARAIAAERARLPPARSTGADDASLTTVDDHAETAVLLLGSGPRLEAVQELEQLLREAESWHAAAPVTRQVVGLADPVRRGRRARGRVDTELRRDAPPG